jgi:hypothetical protein
MRPYFLKCYPHRHVFRALIFCIKHGLSPSVKAGGYGTGGWAINGDVVIDLSKLQDIDIEPPQQGGGYTSLRDTALSVNKGKARAGQPVPDPPGPAVLPKCRIESDAKQNVFGPPVDMPSAWLYGAASAAVANFLTGPALLPDSYGEEPRHSPASHPMLGLDPSILTISSRPDASPFSFDAGGTVSSTGTSTQSSIFSHSSTSGWATFATTPEQSQTPPSDSANSAVPPALPFACAERFETAPSLPDPFAYIDSAESPMMGVSPPASLGSNLIWDSDAALLAHPLFAGEVPSHLTRPVPAYTHAYVSFGAGAGQKDVDVFSAEQPLEGGNVPYHIPLCVYLL